jgi:hypothetical protein
MPGRTDIQHENLARVSLSCCLHDPSRIASLALLGIGP